MKIFKLLVVLICANGIAQETFIKNGVIDKRPELFAFTNATIVVNAKTTITNGTLLIEKGKIKAVGTAVSIPSGAVAIDLAGKYIYPSFIDAFTNYGMPEVKRGARGFGSAQLESNTKGAFNANQAIKPEVNAANIFVADPKTAEEFRKSGFGLASINAMDGIMRGTGALVNFKNAKENEVIVKTKLTSNFSINKGSSTQSMPVSKMGSIALIRQTLLDADWYAKGGSNIERNLSLEAFNEQKNSVLVYDAEDKLDVLRGANVAKEFNMPFVFKTQGDEYQRIAEIAALKASLIVPLTFPQAFDVEDPHDANLVTLKELKHWEMAPANAAILAQNNVLFSFTTFGLKSKADFLPNLKKAIEYGLSEAAALDALTINAAKILKIDQIAGSLDAGKLANFLITSDPIFSKDAAIIEHWIEGEKYALSDIAFTDIRGKYKMIVAKDTLKLQVSGKLDKPDFSILFNDTTKVSPKVTRSGDLFTIQFKKPKETSDTRLSGYFLKNAFAGDGENSSAMFKWSATQTDAFKAEPVKKDTSKAKLIDFGKVLYPFGAFGSVEKPKAETILFKNATVWTNEAEGIAKETDVLVENGKISAFGKSLKQPANAKSIDATGMHLTNGIFDEHSHIGLLTINEVQSVSAEVRMYDVLDPDDVDFYRQLAGGTTSAQLLHGSANCIGGQSALVKFKWGEDVEGIKIKNAPGFIKFALGENVKQGGNQNPVRFPASRMGVEQVMYDAFFRAKDYQKAMAAYGAATNKVGLVPPRKDLELETLSEILNAKRFITCHSYVQSEINMLMKVADSCGFKVNTFTHINEGFKVADKMKKHGVSASTFSDWWAYKMEVKEAIPYNAAILSKVGVNTCINSDDAEMARRLNQEAAKTVLYGGVSEIEAWKMVTLNPAKALHLDDKMGSIKVGKEADLVLWNHNPLSIYARPQYTLVDGTIYFSIEKDEALRKQNEIERRRIITKMLAEKSGGAATTKPTPKRSIKVHCDTILEQESE